MFNRILIVCFGNVCRSPMAECLLRGKLRDRSGVIVESAGIRALVDQPISDTAQTILKERGLDASDHRARQVTATMVQSADLVLAMEDGHLKWLYELAPEVRGRVFLLGKWDQDRPIPDPYHQQRPAYDHVFGLIDQATDAWLDRLS